MCGFVVFGNTETQLSSKTCEERQMEILRFVTLSEHLYGVFQKIEHRLVGHRVPQDVIEHFGDEEADGLFVEIALLLDRLRCWTADAVGPLR